MNIWVLLLLVVILVGFPVTPLNTYGPRGYVSSWGIVLLLILVLLFAGAFPHLR